MNDLPIPVIPSTLVCADTGAAVDFVEPLTVGRHPGSLLRLQQSRVSARHAVVEFDGERWLVRDLGSRNGTTLNNRRITSPAPLKEGQADPRREDAFSRAQHRRLGDRKEAGEDEAGGGSWARGARRKDGLS